MWEYRTEVITIKEGIGKIGGKFDENKISDTFNELGRQNWELVSLIASNNSFGHAGTGIAVFKRPLEQR